MPPAGKFANRGAVCGRTKEAAGGSGRSRATLSRSLRTIAKNDRIQFHTLHGSYDYQVESIEIVKPDDIGVLAPGRYPELTLVTCYPFSYVGAAPDRFIVRARQVAR